MIQSLRTLDAQDHDLGAGYQDTIALLQEEIARLEEELRLRDTPDDDRSQAETASLRAEQALAEMAEELGRRDETIEMLFDQIRSMEEAAQASHAEWEQLENWVREVEQRVDSREEVDLTLQQSLQADLLVTRTRLDMLETESRAWADERMGYQEELARFQNLLDATILQERGSGGDAALLQALEQDNQRIVQEARQLREECEALKQAAAKAARTSGATVLAPPVPAEVEALKSEIVSLRSWIAEMESEVNRTRDTQERERREYESQLAAMRSELTLKQAEMRAVLPVSPVVPPVQPSASATSGVTPSFEALTGRQAPASVASWENMSSEDRMWAFRRHLQEVHQRELEDRKNRRLSARLSRLWSRTRPGE